MIHPLIHTVLPKVIEELVAWLFICQLSVTALLRYAQET